MHINDEEAGEFKNVGELLSSQCRGRSFLPIIARCTLAIWVLHSLKMEYVNVLYDCAISYAGVDSNK